MKPVNFFQIKSVGGIRTRDLVPLTRVEFKHDGVNFYELTPELSVPKQPSEQTDLQHSSGQVNMRYALSLDDLLADTVEKFQINTGSENNPHLNGDILELEEHPRSAGELSIIDRARNTQDLGTGRIYLEEAKDERKPTAPWILLIEDDCVIAGFLSHLLSRRGFEVHLAEDGRKASKMLDEIPPPNLVIMDIMLPFIDGYGLIKLIRSKCEWNDVPILMLTSKTHEQEINRALEEGATDYMMKPFQSCELIARVDQYLA